MPSLSDYTDRLVQHAKAIKKTADATAIPDDDRFARPGGPFTRAVLEASLGDLIRDVDPSELGLFTLVAPTNKHTPPERDARGVPKGEISRVEFTGATPLRKPHRKEEMHKVKETPPEIYAEAALKYLDRYQSVRPMPRAREQVVAIVDDLSALRESLESLTRSLDEAKSARDTNVPSSPKSLAAKEEARIQEIQSRLTQLKKRKEAVVGKKAASQPISKKPPKPDPPAPKVDPQEDEFWNTPAAPARTLRFTDSDDLLMDEDPELGDVSTMSFMSPTAPSPPQSGFAPQAEAEDRSEESIDEEDQTFEARPAATDTPADVDDAGDEEEEEEEEQTIVLNKFVPPVASATPPPSSQPGVKPPPSTGRTKMRVSSEMERIVSKIWTTVGEVIMPGHPFDVSGTGVNKPPRAKETIAHLQTISVKDPSPASPSASSLSSFSAAAPPPPGQPTTQQILIAHLLLTLLSSPPNYAIPLNKIKETLVAKVGGVASQGTTRALYACVAKRLLRIDRGGGEQVVKFDI